MEWRVIVASRVKGVTVYRGGDPEGNLRARRTTPTYVRRNSIITRVFIRKTTPALPAFVVRSVLILPFRSHCTNNNVGRTRRGRRYPIRRSGRYTIYTHTHNNVRRRRSCVIISLPARIIYTFNRDVSIRRRRRWPAFRACKRMQGGKCYGFFSHTCATVWGWRGEAEKVKKKKTTRINVARADKTRKRRRTKRGGKKKTSEQKSGYRDLVISPRSLSPG